MSTPKKSDPAPDAELDPAAALPDAADEDEGPTIKLSTSAVQELERDALKAATARAAAPPSSSSGERGDAEPPDFPTMRLSRTGSSELGPDSHEQTLNVKPGASLQAALPFVPASPVTRSSGSPSDEHTLNIKPGASLEAALPFLALPPVVAAAPSLALEKAPPKSAAVGASGWLDVTRVATIAAELAAGAPATVLAAHGLTAERWAEIERHWGARLAADAELGETERRDAYDEAFLEARARHRGSFGVEAFAELLVESELGVAEHAIGSLAMDVADAMRFQRGWARRAVAEPGLARRLDEAIGRVRARRAGGR